MMKKKIVGILLTVVLVAVLVLSLVACGENNNTPEPEYTIVYVGDSIAEALIGPSPLGERENYGYHALVGRVNGFKYYNHSVSGHLTSGGMMGDDKDGLLEMLKRDDENAVQMKTHLQEADMIHISILGNNMLQYNLGLLMYEVADPQFEANYAEGTTLINALEDGSRDNPMYRDSLDDEDEEVEFRFPSSYQNICDIVTRLKELNPTAKIVFQKVYNPFFEGSKHLSASARAAIAKLTDDGRFGAKGEKIQSIEQLRKLADYLLGKLNGMLDRYLAEHNGDEFIIVDAQAEFERVANMGIKDGKVDLSATSLGASLIYPDWTHPSNFGHAVLAGLTQNMLDELGVSSPNAVANYKAIKKDQINRLYAPVNGFNAALAIRAIDNAETFFDVTMVYFTVIDGYTPVY